MEVGIARGYGSARGGGIPRPRVTRSWRKRTFVVGAGPPAAGGEERRGPPRRRRREGPGRSAGGRYFFPRFFACSAWMAVSAIVKTMSSTRQPRERSFTGFAIPWSIGPIARALALRWTAL